MDEDVETELASLDQRVATLEELCVRVAASEPVFLEMQALMEGLRERQARLDAVYAELERRIRRDP